MNLDGLRSLHYKAHVKEIRPEEFVSVQDVADYLTFGDRESYLEWRAAWKAQYAELSHEIRGVKQARKSEDRAAASEAQATLAKRKIDARMLCVLRKLSKQRAGELREQSLAAVA